MTIGVIGGDGFIGSHLVDDLGAISITRKNYGSYAKTHFDVLINANGNSRKYWANNHPVEDFDLSVVSVYKSLFDFTHTKYIYLSSIDAECASTTYGYHKIIAEGLVGRHCLDYSIIRMPLVIGRGATKGVVHDILNGNVVYLSPLSTVMLLHVKEVVIHIVQGMASGSPSVSGRERLYPNKHITVQEIGEVLNKEIIFAGALEQRIEHYEQTGSLSSSRFYLSKLLKE